MIPLVTTSFGVDEKNNINKCIKSGWISSQGKFVTEFENNFAKWNTMKFGISTSSCTTALHLSLLALNIGKGDEVLCPNLTFISPANMIKLVGAEPILLDVESKSWCMDVTLIEQNITKRTKAILIVHAFGHTANMREIMKISKKYNLYIIEDVAESPGAYFKNKRVGTFGDLSCYSFYANKILTTGEGGMILTNNSSLNNKIRLLRDHGMSPKKRYYHKLLGFNYRMTNMQAAIGVAQLKNINKILDERDDQKNLYEKYLSKSKHLIFRPEEEWSKSVHWLTTIKLRKNNLRNKLIKYLFSKKIESRPMIFPVNFANHFKYIKKNNNVSSDISLNSLHLPSYLGLKKTQIKKISNLIIDWLNKHDYKK